MSEETKLKFTAILKTVVRIAIGAFFITSAILKLLSLDTFELYIYSFNIFGFSLSTVAARAVIACELLAGALMISKIHYREAWWLTMAMLAGFTLLLVYTALFRNDQNCHCLGDIVELKPSLSIVKNIITILLMLPIRNETDYMFKGKKALLITFLAASLAVPFALFPTDNVYNLFKKGEKPVDEATFNAFLQDSVMRNVNIADGNHIVGVLSSGCEFCRISALKISEIVENNDLDSSKVVFFVWGGDNSVEKFKSETNTGKFRYIPIDPLVAVRMVNGSFPTYLYVSSDEEIVRTASLRQMTEKSVVEHLR